MDDPGAQSPGLLAHDRRCGRVHGLGRLRFTFSAIHRGVGCRVNDRITSYNVCYTKLLRLRIRPDGAAIKIDQIREMKKGLSFSPFESRQRVVLIEDVQTMRREAGNSLRNNFV